MFVKSFQSERRVHVSQYNRILIRFKLIILPLYKLVLIFIDFTVPFHDIGPYTAFTIFFRLKTFTRR